MPRQTYASDAPAGASRAVSARAAGASAASAAARRRLQGVYESLHVGGRARARLCLRTASSATRLRSALRCRRRRWRGRWRRRWRRPGLCLRCSPGHLDWQPQRMSVLARQRASATVCPFSAPLLRPAPFAALPPFPAAARAAEAADAAARAAAAAAASAVDDDYDDGDDSDAEDSAENAVAESADIPRCTSHFACTLTPHMQRPFLLISPYSHA